MSGIFHRNIVLMLVSIVVILIMASLSAPHINQNQIDKAKTKFSKNGGGCGGRGGHCGRDCFAGQGHGDGGNQINTPVKWKGNDAKVSAVFITNGGIGKHKGKWSMVCKS